MENLTARLRELVQNPRRLEQLTPREISLLATRILTMLYDVRLHQLNQDSLQTTDPLQTAGSADNHMQEFQAVMGSIAEQICRVYERNIDSSQTTGPSQTGAASARFYAGHNTGYCGSMRLLLDDAKLTFLLDYSLFNICDLMKSFNTIVDLVFRPGGHIEQPVVGSSQTTHPWRTANGYYDDYYMLRFGAMQLVFDHAEGRRLFNMFNLMKRFETLINLVLAPRMHVELAVVGSSQATHPWQTANRAEFFLKEFEAILDFISVKLRSRIQPNMDSSQTTNPWQTDPAGYYMQLSQAIQSFSEQLKRVRQLIVDYVANCLATRGNSILVPGGHIGQPVMDPSQTTDPSQTAGSADNYMQEFEAVLNSISEQLRRIWQPNIDQVANRLATRGNSVLVTGGHIGQPVVDSSQTADTAGNASSLEGGTLNMLGRLGLYGLSTLDP